MRKFVCSICGFIYDEAVGTVWEDLPADFVCPLCGASKSEFKEMGEDSAPRGPNPGTDSVIPLPEGIGYTQAELSALFSNLSKGCEKQYLPDMAELYGTLASYYGSGREEAREGGFASIGDMVKTDLESLFPLANDTAREDRDRGALRALKWSEQVSRMIGSHLKKLESGVPAFLEETNLYVCEICGFIFAGEEKPEICPVCKVPSMRMTRIRRGVA